MNIIKTVLLSLLLVTSAGAIANSLPPTKTYEAMMKSVRLPQMPFGTLSVRECDGCDYETYRVTPRTVYRVDNKAMRLKDFRATLERLALDSEHNVNVTRDIQTNTITAVFLFTQ